MRRGLRSGRSMGVQESRTCGEDRLKDREGVT